MNIIFQINGGIGKSVIATAVCEGIKKKYPESNLIVVTGYPEVFVNNPNVYRSFSFGQLSYFYTEYIQNKAFKVFATDPYLTTSFIQQEKHLIESWFKLFGLTYCGEKPKITLTEREKDTFQNRVHVDKPILIMQTNGGVETQGIKYSWARDIPIHVVQAVINEFQQTHTIVHIRRDDQISFNGTIQLKDEFRAIAAILPLAQIRFFMDSFAQHAATAMGLTSTVLWIANKPKVFGYEENDNIIANPETIKPELRLSYLSKYDITGNPMEFPYNNEREIFNIADVLKSLHAQVEKKAETNVKEPYLPMPLHKSGPKSKKGGK